ncbi:unnamed protein product [Kuraishia capsulata CBS 1993]|uniref:Enoyl reductase (ER) domain-containing protein n=2 Tax=Kuraishia capsulata TaxID=317047 RepID=W6MF22_9ASCO|nr:uncharacterized protein KUCA_T00000094001 [Kuraishia capsulata CBS 1993]AFI38953.1 NADH dependent carbonyl reductase [Kuraishia capsulata]CDK24134.1 unnamed protein product [Kuraishia capsulata CBS 1993]
MSALSKTQAGYIFKKGAGHIVKAEVPIPKPTGAQSLLRVKAAGMCHSDLHVIGETLEVPTDGYVLGHEIAGELVEIGDSVNPEVFKVGGRYAVHGLNSCGSCEMCRTGHDNDCTGNESKWYGLGISGGYQQYLLVPNSHHLLPIPDNVSYEVAAATSDAVLTPYHAIKNSGVTPSSKVLMFGLGGLGSNALQILKAFGAYVVAVDVKPASKAIADEFKADEFYTDISQSSWKPASFDYCFDFVSLQVTFDICQKYIKSHGTIFPVGLGSSKLTFDLGNLALREVKIVGNFWGTSQEQIEAMELVSSGRVKPQVHTTELENLPESLEKLEEGKINGRLVMLP